MEQMKEARKEIDLHGIVYVSLETGHSSMNGSTKGISTGSHLLNFFKFLIIWLFVGFDPGFTFVLTPFVGISVIASIIVLIDISDEKENTKKAKKSK